MNTSRALISLRSAILLLITILVASTVIAYVWFPREFYDRISHFGLIALFGIIISLFWGLFYSINESIEMKRKLSDLEGKIDEIRRDLRRMRRNEESGRTKEESEEED